MKDGKPITGPSSAIARLALSPDGRFLAAHFDGKTRLWSLP
ncbi:hypothetical protein [Streptomyces niveus]|nr:hypothetical protein [Streptomyces niveus]